MDLPLFSASLAALALTLYVMLDGFDLGVGVLLLFQPHNASRDHMINSITPTWDGNETWLVMTGITLFTAFPIAYGILMPAFYLPIVIMLLCLGIRGVSFEFRVQMKQVRRRWDLAFGIASLVAAFMQGLVLGGIIQGVAVQGSQFSGSLLDDFRALPLLSGTILAFGYSVLGAGWLYLKANRVIERFAIASLRMLTPTFLVLSGIACLYAARVQPEIHVAWVMHSAVLSIVTVLIVLVGATLTFIPLRGRTAVPFTLGIVLFLLGMAAFAVIVFPNIIPFKLSLWEAASSSSSQIFLLAGAALVTPVILAYSAFAYWVFRGRTPERGWGE